MNVADMKALKQLGMRYLVMGSGGTAVAFEQRVKIDKTKKYWVVVDKEYFGKVLMPEKLNNYCDNWKESLIDLNNECAA